MPNTMPPIVNTEQALKYRQFILDSLPPGVASSTFQPLMTLYLTDKTTPEEIKKAHATGMIHACKYYPAGATTNSEFGVTDVSNIYPALEAMQQVGMRLCIHSEVTHADIFEREPVFIQEIMQRIVPDFPSLYITMEHISTKEAVDYVLSAPDNVKATITCHHLMYNRNHLLVGGIRPHLYCLPILKAEVHRQALVQAATSGSPKFFAGTDSAPHETLSKESACGCAGVFTAHAAVEFYTETFEEQGALDKLENFVSLYGAQHYGLEPNTATMTLVKEEWTVPKDYDFGDGRRVTPMRAGETVKWKIVQE